MRRLYAPTDPPWWRIAMCAMWLHKWNPWEKESERGLDKEHRPHLVLVTEARVCRICQSEQRRERWVVSP